jgi:hypothetical protein
MSPDPLAPADLRDLGYGEHVLLWSFRAFAVGRWGCPLVVRGYEDACGPLAQRAREAVQVFAQQVQVQGRRPIVLGSPGLLSITRDEQLLLAIYAAAQRWDEARCSAHLAWLLAKPAGAPFYAAACVTAQAFAFNGCHFRAPVDVGIAEWATSKPGPFAGGRPSPPLPHLHTRPSWSLHQERSVFGPLERIRGLHIGRRERAAQPDKLSKFLLGAGAVALVTP